MTRFDAFTRRAVIGGATAAVVATAVPSAAQAASCGIDQRQIDAATAGLESDLIALRRDLHANPEASGEEDRTAGIVAELLTAAGLQVITGVGGHGVVGILKGGRPGRTVAYRADMDAVTDGGTAPDHLCGHDLHTTIGVGIAQVLAGMRRRLNGTVVFFFQPAEESLEGAKAMIADDVLRDYAPKEIHALHCGPIPLGVFALTPNSGLPGQDRGSVVLTGADAVARAERLAEAIGALNTVPFPETSADIEQIVADVQIPDGPLSEFVFMRATVTESTADRAAVKVVYRCWPEEDYTAVRDEVARIAAEDGAAVAAFPNDPFPAMIGPERDALALGRHLRRAIGRDSTGVMHAPFPFNGEDFALFFAELPGTYSFIGVRAPGSDITTAAPHFPTFEPDERAIGHGVRAMAGWLAQRSWRD